ncbi:MAG: adenosylcobinamide-GDP ribazoletransferase [Actinobacteria bacterium]|nr:adenosylcobinamide-GDP ribazoletransferase [Actinomycetota bacterium]MBE3115548.1 adenosylcobinamide-GDP ribazoletransferase [Actinomycetota bacterium]
MSKFINALGFLTIIKIPKKYILKREQVADSTVYFPIAGLVIGIILSLFYFVASFIFPVFLSVILLLGLEVFLSGGAHLDGLGDMFDGTFSGRSDKNKILEIMKKSDIGVYGILSIVFLLLLKISIVYYLASINSGHVLIFYLTIIFMPAFGRWSMVFLIGRYKNARGSSSLAKIFTDNKNKRKNFYISSIYLFLLFLVLYTFFGYLTGSGVGSFSFLNNLESVYLILFILAKALLVTSALFLLLLPLSWFFTRRIGGITGDIIGGVSEIVELLFLFINYLVFTFFI